MNKRRIVALNDFLEKERHQLMYSETELNDSFTNKFTKRKFSHFKTKTMWFIRKIAKKLFKS